MEPKLKDWVNAEKVGTRFPPSRQLCPNCNQATLEDRWPPDYGGGSSGGKFSKTWVSQKFVCVPCRIAFRVSYHETIEYVDDGTFLGNKKVDRTVTVLETVPLVEQDGCLLTPYDVGQEEYKREHGEYPSEAYA